MWLYILHYDEVLHHSQHYCGQTPNPPQRFQAHARGAGSAITQEFARRGIKFHVGMLCQCSQAKASQFERGLKNSKNLADYCAICAAAAIPPRHATTWPGSQRYDATLLPELTSEIKWTKTVARPSSMHKPAVATPIQRLQDTSGDHAVGYLTTEAIQDACDQRRIRCLTIDTEDAGYILFSKNRNGTITIQQIVIHADHRGQNYGRALVEYLAAEFPAAPLRCHVRQDLVANLFWEAIGFIPKTTKTHKTSGQTLIEYQRPCFLHHFRKDRDA